MAYNGLIDDRTEKGSELLGCCTVGRDCEEATKGAASCCDECCSVCKSWEEATSGAVSCCGGGCSVVKGCEEFTSEKVPRLSECCTVGKGSKHVVVAEELRTCLGIGVSSILSR